MKLFISPTPPEGSRQRIQFPVFPLRIIYTITGSRRKTKAVILAEATVFICPERKSVKAAVAIRETKPAPAMSSSICPAVRGSIQTLKVKGGIEKEKEKGHADKIQYSRKKKSCQDTAYGQTLLSVSGAF